MNCLNQDQWFKIYQICLLKLEEEKISNEDILKLVLIIEELDFPIQKEQKEALTRKACEQLINNIQDSDLSQNATNELIQIFKITANNLNKEQYSKFFEKLDVELSIRVNELSNEQFANICQIASNQNTECQTGNEIILQYFLTEGENTVSKNLPYYTKLEFINIIAAYILSGCLKQFTDLLNQIQHELKQRLLTLGQDELTFLLRIFSVSDVGNEEIYMLFDRYIGKNLDFIEAKYLYLILKSFYDSGHARQKLFIKLQSQILNHSQSLDVNVLCAILRLYAEMDIKQHTFYEQLAQVIENQLSKLDETGFLNCFIGFKRAPTMRPLPILSDLEKILVSNLNAFGLQSLTQILYTYAVQQDKKSNQKLIDKLTEFTIAALEQFKEQNLVVDAATLLQLIASFSRLQLSADIFKLFIDDLQQAVQFYNDEDLQMIGEIVYSLSQKNEGFERALTSITNEIQNRKNYE